ncbi:hypothetical protein HPB52_018074 [Rhipicephalus sanguineus]|uniref:Secreted protein n=1 Tax=Rhipicephalus sanguineus TaxID=34632 RepID=A0A9D4QE14_RHISA|nr:hypothetical protein HPB52_018074 [Rhipicephalus sanguineus]
MMYSMAWIIVGIISSLEFVHCGRGQDRGRGLPGAVFAGRGLTRVLGSCDLYCWVGRNSDSTALHTVAHLWAVKRASRATCVLAHVNDRIMLGRRGPKL